MSEFSVASNGITLHGDDDGEGPPILLLHGLSATRRYVLHGSTALIRDGYRLIAYDARGHGESDPAPASTAYGYAAMVQDAVQVMDDRGIDRAVVVALPLVSTTVVVASGGHEHAACTPHMSCCRVLGIITTAPRAASSSPPRRPPASPPLSS